MVKPFLVWGVMAFMPLFMLVEPVKNWWESVGPPIIGNFEYEVITNTETEVTVKVSGEKYLPCVPKSVTAFTSVNGIMLKLPRVKFSNLPAEERIKSLTIGWHDLGVWTINTSFIKGKIDNVEFKVVHDCGGPLNRVTSLGKWKV